MTSEDTKESAEIPDDSESPDEPDSDLPEVPVGTVPESPFIPPRLITLYEEGTGSDKRLTIWGPAKAKPAECAVEIFTNGATDSRRSIPLPASFPADGFVHLCSEAAWTAECTHEMSGSLFNGNDALVVQCSGVVVDSLGTVGVDPGVGWSSETAHGVLSTANQRLVRCGSVPDVDPSDATDLGRVWSLWARGPSGDLPPWPCAVDNTAPDGTGGGSLGGAAGE
jgi:hypothetical protein